MIDWFKSLFGGNQLSAPAAVPAPDAAAASRSDRTDSTIVPFEIVTVNGAQALRTLMELRNGRPGLVPVAFGDCEEFDGVVE